MVDFSKKLKKNQDKELKEFIKFKSELDKDNILYLIECMVLMKFEGRVKKEDIEAKYDKNGKIWVKLNNTLVAQDELEIVMAEFYKEISKYAGHKQDKQ